MLIRVDRVAGGAGSAANTSMLPLTPVAPASSRAKRYVLCASWAPVPNPPGSKLGGYGGGVMLGPNRVYEEPAVPVPLALAWEPRGFAQPVPDSGGSRLVLLLRPAPHVAVPVPTRAS